MMRSYPAIGLAVALTLGGCAVQQPMAPKVMALPGPGKNFAAFQQDDGNCRQYAYYQSGSGAGAQQATNNALGTAAAGTLLGAGAGAALGSLSGRAGSGAVVGATMGALVGGSAAYGGAQRSAYGLQRQYDMSYTQCMVAHGDSVQSPPGGYN